MPWVLTGVPTLAIPKGDMLLWRALRYRYPGSATELTFADWQLTDAGHGLLLGDSGSGKTTLLNLVTGLLRPTQGTVLLGETDIASLPAQELDRFRGRHIGMVPQRPHLLASLSVAENLTLAQYLAGLPQDGQRVRAVLDALGLDALAQRRPQQLSQGQAQRVAIARAVINRPQLIVADEPTASLDDGHAQAVLDLLEQQAAACGASLLLATHDARVKQRFAQRLQLPTLELSA